MEQDQQPADDQGLWVRSDVLPDGSYGVTLTVGADAAWTLDRDEAITYAVSAIQTATEAEHDAAVFTLMTRTGMSQEDAAWFINQDLRTARPDGSIVGRLKFTSGVSTSGPFVAICLDNGQVGQVSPTELREHAAGVLTTIAAVDLDAALANALMSVVGLSQDVAQAFVSDLPNAWPESMGDGRSNDDGK